MAALFITVNGVRREITSPPETPLLFVLRDELGLSGPRFGCGLDQCGACAVLRGAEAVASCRLPVGEVADAQITTLEGLGTPDEPHPVQRAFLEEQAAQCGYCYNGMVIKAAELLARTQDPSEAQIRTAMNGHLCRCGTYPRILKAIQRAAKVMAGAKA